MPCLDEGMDNSDMVDMYAPQPFFCLICGAQARFDDGSGTLQHENRDLDQDHAPMAPPTGSE
jgi:hypothetical protein